MWHISTSSLIFTAKFEVCMVEFLFEYEVWRRLRQVLCVFGTKMPSVLQNFYFCELGEGYPFLDETPKRHFLGQKHAF